MERSEDDQWSWWQQNPDATASYPLSTTASFQTGDPSDGESTGATSGQAYVSSPTPAGGNDPVRKMLIGLVAVLSLGLAGVSYQRWGAGTTDAAVAATTTTAVTTQVANQSTTISPTTQAPATSADPTTTAPATTAAPTTSTTEAVAPTGPPGAPIDVEVVSTGRSSAEIRWTSNECVGSRYQVGDFQPGGGGYPDVNRCWFNHVILAGDPAFSPPLEPNTTYTVRIEAIAQDGSASEPAQVEFTTSP